MFDPLSVPSALDDDTIDMSLRDDVSRFDATQFPPPLDETTQYELLHRAAHGDRAARNTLIEHNLRLIMHVITHKSLPPMPWEDAMQIGVLGLIHAIEKFDPSRGTRFSTYAVPWIRQAIQRAYEQTGTLIRVPGYQHLTARKDSPSATASALQSAAAAALMEPLSFDHPLTADTETPFGAILPDPHGNPEDHAIVQDEYARLQIAFQSLPMRLQRIFLRYYGLDGQPPVSAQAIARTEGVSSTRIYQLLAEGLSRLRQHPALQESPPSVLTSPAFTAGVDDPA